MAAEIKKEIALEIAHVLFMDIVAYSKMAMDDQRAAIEKLNQVVQSTDEYRKAESENRLLKIATGDGMALIFYHSPEDPVECALEISRAIKEQHSDLRLRMGVHSGPVSGVVDVNGRANVAGAGINTAQRVMDCGDAGHILLSKRVAEDLEQFKHWRPHLYHLGQCEVKHGEKIDIVNLFTAELGNSERPQRLTKSSEKTDVVPVSGQRQKSRKSLLIVAACVAIAALAIAAFLFWSRAVNLILSTSFSTADRPALLRAVDLLNQAVAHDPSFFDAYCRLAYAHDNLYFISGDHTPARLAMGEAAVQAALRLRPDAGEAHMAHAEHLYRGYLDHDRALAELDIARRTLPNDPRVFELTGYIVRRRGRQDEGLRYLERALELDPRNFFTLQQIAFSYSILRRYGEETTVLDRAVGIKPDDVDTKVARASVDFDARADTRPLHQTLASARAKDPAAMENVANSWFNCALAERDPAAARDALMALGENNFGMDISQFAEFRGSFGEALIARMMRDEAKAREAFTAARTEQQKSVEAQPNYGPALSALGLVDAALGRKEQALQEGRRAVELLPVDKDSVNGIACVEYLAIIAAWVGEKDLAFEQLERAVRLPNTLSYGQLKLLPYWDPLRNDPRFEKLVAE